MKIKNLERKNINVFQEWIIMSSPANPSTMNFEEEMYLTKRDGRLEMVSFDKILQRIKTLGKQVNLNVNYTSLCMKVIDLLYDKISTTQIDELSAEQCASMSSTHYDYNILAGRILISNHHKNTQESFTDAMERLYTFIDKTGVHSPIVSESLIQTIRKYGDQLNSICDYSRDYLIYFFGFKTLDRAYLLKIDKKTIERPQHMWMRVSIGIH